MQQVDVMFSLATNALMPFSLSPEQLKARAEIRRRAEVMADLLINGVRVCPTAQDTENRKTKHVRPK